MKTLAAVLVETGKPLVLGELEIPVLKSGQVLVKITMSGVCHTQILECRGYRGEDRFLPHCLGHEGTGIVCEVGPGVQKVKQGDTVVLSWIKGSGADIPGSVYQWNGKSVNAGAITTFSQYSVISENRLTVIPNNLPKRECALLGCSVPTGVGVVFNTLQAKPGQSLAVYGVGGVGLCVIMGATISGCAPIIAVDVNSSKLDIATKLGATHIVNAVETIDLAAAVCQICPGGVDLAVEASGYPNVMKKALESVKNQGGVAVIIGNARHGEYVELDPRQFNLGKRLLGTWGGDNWPDRDFPRYIKLMSCGRLNLSPILSNVRTYSLEQINQAIDDLEAGLVTRPLIEMASEQSGR
jgi:S-(hydroxymethyl)glutathione dehydrogenase/alcohol dehydrogenase